MYDKQCGLIYTNAKRGHLQMTKIGIQTNETGPSVDG